MAPLDIFQDGYDLQLLSETLFTSFLLFSVKLPWGQEIWFSKNLVLKGE